MKPGIVILVAMASCAFGCSPTTGQTDADANSVDITSDTAPDVPNLDVPRIVDAVAVDVPVHVGSCVEPELSDAGNVGDAGDAILLNSQIFRDHILTPSDVNAQNCDQNLPQSAD